MLNVQKTNKTLDIEIYFDYITRMEQNAPFYLHRRTHRAGGARGVSFHKRDGRLAGNSG